MIILALRTDKPEAELYLYEDSRKLSELKWQADRSLTKTIHRQMDKLLNKSSNSLKDIQGTVCFKGPGSFTGLRIGLSVANTLAYSYNTPIVARGGKNWVETGIKDLLAGKNDQIALPEYDRPAATTPPRK